MGLDQIISRIKQDAEAKADAVLSSAREQAEQKLDLTRQQAAELTDKIVADGREQVELERGRVLTLGRLEQRKLILSAKQQVISEAFNRALSDLVSMPADDYFDLLKSIVVSASAGGEEIVLNNRDRDRLPADFVDLVNSELAAQGRPGNLKLGAGTRDIAGGVVLVRDRVEANMSFDTALSQLREELTIDVARQLFNADKDEEDLA